MPAGTNQPSDSIAKLDYQPNEQSSLLHQHEGDDDSPAPSPAVAAGNGFFEAVADGLRDRDRQQFRREVSRYVSFAWAVVCTYDIPIL